MKTNEPQQDSQLDILRHIERLTDEINRIADRVGRPVFKKYPITFAILVLFGVIAVSEGAKEILKSLGIFDGNPWVTLLFGLGILILTGRLYKKLNK